MITGLTKGVDLEEGTVNREAGIAVAVFELTSVLRVERVGVDELEVGLAETTRMGFEIREDTAFGAGEGLLIMDPGFAMDDRTAMVVPKGFEPDDFEGEFEDLHKGVVSRRGVETFDPVLGVGITLDPDRLLDKVVDPIDFGTTDVGLRFADGGIIFVGLLERVAFKECLIGKGFEIEVTVAEVVMVVVVAVELFREFDPREPS